MLSLRNSLSTAAIALTVVIIQVGVGVSGSKEPVLPVYEPDLGHAGERVLGMQGQAHGRVGGV